MLEILANAIWLRKEIKINRLEREKKTDLLVENIIGHVNNFKNPVKKKS